MPTVQPLIGLRTSSIQADVIRLDTIHPVVSGNKWYKLRYYLEQANQLGCSEIASFGGVYSNHIVAAAFASHVSGFASIGFIRGEQDTPTLQEARAYGMRIEYVNRTDYRNKAALMQTHQAPDRYWIPEGGYGDIGAKGAATILESVQMEAYTDIICAVGSGTMMAGLVNGSLAEQKVIGISSQKNNGSLLSEVQSLVHPEQHHRMQLLHDYHFGGFARHTPELIGFMKHFWEEEKIPTDIVYTGKLFYALQDLIRKNYFKSNSKLLIVHSGGLQGNCSLMPGLLPF